MLTNPGERIMEPDFGVGLKRFLFQNFHDGVYAEVDSAIREQASMYMPAVTIISVLVDSSRIDTNQLSISLKYSIPNIGATDLLEFTI